jgi:hypothetical protein
MATTETAPTLHHFLVYAPDKTEEGTFEKRLTVRSKHLENVGVLIGNGVIKVGGVILTPESIESATSTPKMTGSMLIIQATNIEAVKKVVETDIYYTTGVWDPEKLVIAPFISATPLP